MAMTTMPTTPIGTSAFQAQSGAGGLESFERM
jgi:hypothetical protein